MSFMRYTHASLKDYLFRFIEFMAFVLPFKGYWVQGFDFDDFCLSFSAFLASNSPNCSDFGDNLPRACLVSSELDGCCRSRCLVGKRVKDMQGFMGGDAVSWIITVFFLSWPFPNLWFLRSCILNEGILVRLFEYSLSSCQDHWGGIQNCSKPITKTSYSHKY